MAGFRDFQTGEVLTAANVNDFLGKQAVMKFADASARDTALGTAVGGANALREGMVAYLDDTNELQTFDGTAWGAVGGGLVAVKSALFTGTQSNSTASGANFAVTDLSITHQLADASNKLIITVSLGMVASSRAAFPLGMAVNDSVDGLIGVGDAASIRPQTTSASSMTGATSNKLAVGFSSTFVYAPGDTTSRTYTARAVNVSEVTATIHVNRNDDDTNSALNARTASFIVIQEVSV